MLFDIKIHKKNLPNTHYTKFNEQEMYMEIDDKLFFQELDRGQIILNNKTAFFVNEKNSNKVFKVSVADFRPGGFIGFPLVEEYTSSQFTYDEKTSNINGTIEFI